MVAAGIKSSSNIEEIKKLLKKKFLEDDTRAIGIGQLVKSITQIVENKFPFDEYVKEKLGDKYNCSFIRDLTFIDMDTLIYWLPHLKKKDANFRKIIEAHHQGMSYRKKINTPDLEKGRKQANAYFHHKLSPISNRLPKYRFPRELMPDWLGFRNPQFFQIKTNDCCIALNDKERKY